VAHNNSQQQVDGATTWLHHL